MTVATQEDRSAFHIWVIGSLCSHPREQYNHWEGKNKKVTSSPLSSRVPSLLTVGRGVVIVMKAAHVRNRGGSSVGKTLGLVC